MMNKKKWYVLIFILSIVILFSNVPSSHATTYSNEKINFSIEYPDGWTKYESYNQTNNLVEIQFRMSDSALIDIQFFPNSLPVILRNSDDVNLSSLQTLVTNTCRHLPPPDDQQCAKVTIYSSDITTIDGKKAYQIKFSLSGITQQIDHTAIIIPLNSAIYSIEAAYDAHILSYDEQIRQSLSTIHIGDVQTSIQQSDGGLALQKNPQSNTDSDYTTVTTDKAEYQIGDTVQISGHVNQLNSGMPVTVIVRNPSGTPVLITQLPVASDRSFSTQMTIQNQGVWDLDGTYKVSVQYGAGESAATSFTLIRNPNGSTPSIAPSQSPILPETNSEPQMKIDFSGNTLFIIIGAIIAVIVGIVIYSVSKSRKSGTSQSGTVPSFGRGDVSRIIELKGKTVYIEITAQYPDSKPSSSWNYGTDRKIGSGSSGGYMLTINLQKKDKSLMTEIVNVIEKYGFNSLLVNFQNHKSFKNSQYVGTGNARQMLYDICRDLETEFEHKNKSTESHSSRNGRVDESTKASPINEPHSTEPRNPDPVHEPYNRTETRNASPVPESYTSTEPPKVESKHARESIFTGKAPIGDGYDDITRNVKRSPRKNDYEDMQKQDEEKGRLEKEMEEIRRRQDEEKQKRERENQSKSRQNIQTGFDPYQVLGLSKTCSCAELKAKYRELITKPENALAGMLNMSSEEVERRTKIQSDINKARDQIVNEKKCGK